MSINDGTALRGFTISPEYTKVIDFGRIQPTILLESGEHVPFWYGLFSVSSDKKAAIYDRLGKPPSDIFPITFRVMAGLSPGINTGRIMGFYSQQEGEKEKIEQ